MGKLDDKCFFWEGVENSTFKMAKKTIFFNDKILVLRLKKAVQFAWAKEELQLGFCDALFDCGWT